MKYINSFNIEEMLGMRMSTSKNKKRGVNVYSYADLLGTTGRDKYGNYQYTTQSMPYFLLSVDERMEIFRSCAPIFGIVTGRQNKISALEWHVIPDSKREDKLADDMKKRKSLYEEYTNTDDLKYKIAGKMIAKELRDQMPELLPDLSNFNNALFRWSKTAQSTKQDIADEVEEWLREPSIGVSWEDFIKQYVFDLMIHGCGAIYKEVLNKRIENFYVMLGGSVFPARSEYLGGAQVFVQATNNVDALIYFGDEVVYSDYVPTSSRSSGYVPLEALINKIAESLLFDKLMADQADGTKPPEKMVVFGDHSPFGDISSEFNLPATPEDQERVEQVLNERKKEAVRTLTGMGQPVILDLSRENTMQTQMERQRMIREEIALVYNASNLEINMSDSSGVSGRSTSESLETIDQNKSILPIVRIIENSINRQILPYRCGSGYKVEFAVTSDPDAELDRYIKMAQSGLWGINEIRINEIGTDPIDDPAFDKPASPQSADPMAGGGDGSDPMGMLG